MAVFCVSVSEDVVLDGVGSIDAQMYVEIPMSFGFDPLIVGGGCAVISAFRQKYGVDVSSLVYPGSGYFDVIKY